MKIKNTPPKKSYMSKVMSERMKRLGKAHQRPTQQRNLNSPKGGKFRGKNSGK